MPPPSVSSLPRVPIYTFPFATVGTVNFTAFPAVSRPPDAWELFHSSVETLLASYACRTAGPARACPLSLVPYAAALIAHTMPSVVADEAEMEGVAPGNPNVEGV